MSRSDKTVSAHQGPAASTERIEDVDVSTEMQGSFLEYAYSVIYSRALPDARDGLKPVQRRILYQMSEMGLRPDRGHVKSARVVGEVMGKLHPHGDTAIYDAMVRMAQAFTLRVPLIDGHGNFGSLDDGPAAPRYTEARLAAPALAMTEHLDEDVVDFVPNYDNQLTQPDVLPAAYPNLLVNGASGIAVGMATNMAPHNLVEVIGAARHLLAHPRATLDELMEFVPGPDLPTGGTIVGLAGIKDAYLTGRGSFKTRAKVSVEAITARKAGLVVSELPYLVGPERVIEKIKDGVNSKKLSGISDVTDLTDRTKGLRLVIGIKTGFSPEAVLEQLYRVTPLEDSFNINAVALVDGGPQTLGLVELLQVYVNHRVEVVTRRSAYRLARRRERLHLVEGLLIAILDIDEVIQVIRASDDTEQARTRLIDVFDLSQLQAEYILELRLRRLTRFSRIELETERDQLLAEIKELEALLASKQAIRTLVSDELATISDRFGTPRRTLLTEARPSIAGASARKTAVLEVSDSPTRVYLSSTGRIARVDLPQPGDDQTERITPAHRRSKHDAVLSALDTTSRSEIGAVTNRGRLIRFSPVDLPVLPPTSIQLAAGVRVRDYLSLGSGGEVVRALVSLDSERAIALGTRQGIVKRVTPNDWANKPDFEIIALKAGDEVVGAVQGAEDDELVFVASDAQLLRFPASTVRPQGRTAGGMAGIKLGPDARVVFFTSLAADAAEDAVVATIASGSQTLPGTDPGSAKVSAFTEFPAKGRATGGVRSHRFLKGEDVLAVAWVGAAPARALGIEGSPRTLPDTGARRDASGTMLDAVVGSIGSGIG
ncbi:MULTISPECIES: DNA gyrase/topoisomerase IV subunit A [Cryobacterium]|uniref:DNA topoisomerase (ATP-hydrolyzing) n=1 Tax=Cryobacterium zongtaii TaxID=1259217 RepID=A0A2S3ZIC3_9MICO|nr:MULTISPECIES: DNA topoisomerase IV subunit A [Cryobacterium]POH65403.1 DNA topoisomerase IV [Cryobacterium zongtaii]POH67320.1 DNA topoisomerase IV [Cryobacterium zongtaii]TFC45102.1 DNA topoisomerase IV subunit A [Cryobacterium sp. TMN-39-2]